MALEEIKLQSRGRSAATNMADAELLKKLAALTAVKDALIQENTELRQQLEDSEAAALQEELDDVKAECEERLGGMQKTVAALRSERETLLKRLEGASHEGEGRASELAALQATAQQLRDEGSSLAKKNAEVQAVVRKLRQSLRECEAQRDELGERLGALEATSARAAEATSCGEATLAASLEVQAEHSRLLHARVAETEALAAEREDSLRSEVSRLQRWCDELQSSRDEQTFRSTDASAPLLRQLDELTRSAREAAESSAETCARLSARALAAEAAAVQAQTGERAARARARAAEEAAKDKAAHAARASGELGVLMQRCVPRSTARSVPASP